MNSNSAMRKSNIDFEHWHNNPGRDETLYWATGFDMSHDEINMTHSETPEGHDIVIEQGTGQLDSNEGRGPNGPRRS